MFHAAKIKQSSGFRPAGGSGTLLQLRPTLFVWPEQQKFVGAAYERLLR